MPTCKSVKQNYAATPAILGLLEDFRLMVNDCIRGGLDKNGAPTITSMKSLSKACYHALEPHDIPTAYRLTAISKAAGILRNYRKALKDFNGGKTNKRPKRPYARKLTLTDCYAFKIQGNTLRLTLRAHEYAYVELYPHTRQVLAQPEITPRSITLTESHLSICYSKQVEPMHARGLMGMDRNLENVTAVDSDGEIMVKDLSRCTQVKAKCRETRRHFKRSDVRIRKAIYLKYGTLQRDRVIWILHNATSELVRHAKEHKLAIVMEDLKGIRKLYRKGNGQGREYRAVMNAWSDYEFERQLRYKAEWEGVEVIHVSPWGTSSKCSACGSKMIPEESRMMRCPRCGMKVDRDVNAANNILKKGGLRFGPDGGAGEAMVRVPLRQEQKAIPKVDAPKALGGESP